MWLGGHCIVNNNYYYMRLYWKMQWYHILWKGGVGLRVQKFKLAIFAQIHAWVRHSYRLGKTILVTTKIPVLAMKNPQMKSKLSRKDYTSYTLYLTILRSQSNKSVLTRWQHKVCAGAQRTTRREHAPED